MARPAASVGVITPAVGAAAAAVASGMKPAGGEKPAASAPAAAGREQPGG